MIDWVSVPSGPVIIGTPVSRVHCIVTGHADLGIPAEWILKETPVRVVPVPGFEMARTPITVEQYGKFAAATGRTAVAGEPELPVRSVRYGEAIAFCAWLAQRIGSRVVLPSELQWERAARGSDGREYPWGNQWAAGLANTAEAEIGTPTPVGSYPRGASPFGLLDMAGNVDEWTRTRYAPYPGAPYTVPAIEDWALDVHVTRGGSYLQGRDLARCARRHGLYYEHALAGTGFRVVRETSCPALRGCRRGAPSPLG